MNQSSITMSIMKKIFENQRHKAQVSSFENKSDVCTKVFWFGLWMKIRIKVMHKRARVKVKGQSHRQELLSQDHRNDPSKFLWNSQAQGQSKIMQVSEITTARGNKLPIDGLTLDSKEMECQSMVLHPTPNNTKETNANSWTYN